MSDFTPGPWYVFENGHCVGGPESAPGAGEGIAMCGMRARSPAEAAANASLISASPDMYAVLKAVEWTYCGNLEDECPCCHHRRSDKHDRDCPLEYALEKARGPSKTPIEGVESK